MASSGFKGATSRKTSIEFVGRERELALLTGAIDDALTGRARLLLIAGEPGIGKTALSDAAAAHATQSGFRVLWGPCWEGDGAPAYWPWVQLLRSYIRARTTAELYAEMADATPVIARIVPELADRFLSLPALAEEADPERARFQLFDGVATFLKNAAAAAPLFLILDDIHWADGASLLLLKFLARALHEAPVVIVATYRDVEVSRDDPISRLLGDLPGDRIPLRGLPHDDVAELMHLTLGSDAAHGIVDAIHQRTTGNPFFVKEVVRLLDAQGRLGESASTLRLSIPEGVRDVVGRRIARLSDECARVLETASVLGNEFRANVLATIASVPADHVLQALDEAVRVRLVSEAHEGAGEYVFAHALVREVLYEGLSAGTRARLHDAAGEALEKLHADALDSHLAELAHHFIRSLPGGNAAKAASYAGRAGARALGLYAYDEAANHFRRAIDAMRTSGAPANDRTGMMLNLADALTRAGDLPAARETYGAAAALARETGNAESLAHAALGLGTGLGGFEVKLFDDVQITLLREALDALPDDDSAVRAWLLARLSVALSYVESTEARAALSTDAVAMARRVGDPTALAYALSSMCDAMSAPEHTNARIESAREMVRLAEDIRALGGANSCGVPSCVICLCDPEMSLLARRFLIVAHLERGDIASADAEIDTYARLADHLRQPLYQWFVPLWKAMRALLAGHWDDDEKLVAEAQRLGERAHSDNAFILCVSHRADRALIRDEYESFPTFWRALTDRFPSLGTAPQGQVVKLLADIGEGEPEKARALLERLNAERFENVPRDAEFLSTLTYAAFACWLLDEAGPAGDLYRLMEPFADLFVVDGIGASVLCAVSYPLALLASLLNKPKGMQRHFDAALRAHTAIGATPLVERTQRDYEAALARTGTRPALVKSAGQARGEFRREGEYWTIGFGDVVGRLKHSKGLRDIAWLISSPGTEVHASDLVAADAAAGTRTAAAGELTAREGDAGPVLDDRARAEYKERLVELEDELREAEDNNDTGRAARVRESIDFIAAELSAAYGLGGRPRKVADPNERARKAVTERIRDALSRVEKTVPPLGRHLRRSIRTGTFCSYEPDEQVTWTL